MQNKINSLLEKLEGKAGIIIKEAGGGVLFSHNASMVFPSASIIKQYILWELYSKAARGELSLDSAAAIAPGNRVGGYGVLKDMAADSLTVKDLSLLMIALSDNIATNTLIDLAGMDDVNRAAKALGCTNTVLQRKMMDLDAKARGLDNFTSPEDVALLLGNYLESPLLPAPLRQEMAATLKKQIYQNFLAHYMPESFSFAHKTGDLPGVLHDTGILYTPGGKTLIVAVMTKELKSNISGLKFLNALGEVIFDSYA